MLAVHEDLGLDDRDQAILLARRGVAREAVGILADGLLGGAGGARRDLEDRAPLGEAGAEAVVLGAARAKPVEAGAVRLAVGAGERLDALVDLDAGDHALLLEELDEGLALLGLLAEGLVEHDAARDVLAKIGRQEEQLAVRAAVLLFVGDADRGEALADGAVGLVRRQDALPPHAMALAVAASSSRYLAPGPAVAKSSASKEKPKEQAEDLAFLAFLAPAEEARFFFGILGWGCVVLLLLLLLRSWALPKRTAK